VAALSAQTQRVALARALIYRPTLRLMDEPLGALGKKLRDEMQMAIKRVHREGRMSVPYVTHDQEETLTMSDRIAVFSHGSYRAGRYSQGSLRAPRDAVSRLFHRRDQLLFRACHGTGNRAHPDHG